MVKSEASVLSGNKGGSLQKGRTYGIWHSGGSKGEGEFRWPVSKGSVGMKKYFWLHIYGRAMYNAGIVEERLFKGLPRRWLNIAEYALKRLRVYL